MITENHVSLEIAKLLNQNGFNEDTDYIYYYYESDDDYCFEKLLPGDKFDEDKNKPKVHSVSLITRSKAIRTEADVDAYLSDLKKQIMAKINGKDDIIIQ